MEICRWTLLIYAIIAIFFSQVGTLVNSSFGNEYIWFLKNAMYLE